MGTSSKSRTPAGRWPVTWVAALVVTAASIGGWDLYLRVIGYRPSVSDSAELWALHRGSVYPRSEDDSVLVLVGASRIALGISLPTIRDALPGYRVVQLAIVGGGAWPLLADLAADRRFRGVVLASVMEPSLINPGAGGRSLEYLNRHHAGLGLNGLVNTWIGAHIEALSPVRLGSVGLANLVNFGHDSLAAGTNYSVMDYSRSWRADYSRVTDLPRLRFRRLSLAPAQHVQGPRGNDEIMTRRFAARVDRLGRMVDAIERRGGRVALVKFPVADEITRGHSRKYPRPLFWDTLDSLTGATTVHYLDHRSLQGFAVPDASHLDQSERTEFTEALIDVLREEGFF